MKNLTDKAEPLKKKYDKCEKLRNIILLLENNIEFVNLPQLIEQNISKNSI